MPLVELNLRFPTAEQVIVRFNANETENLAFQSPVTKKDLADLGWYIEVYAAQCEPD
jgi:hypothetical protein